MRNWKTVDGMAFPKKKKSIRKIHFLNLKLACIWFYMPNAEMHLLTQFLKAIQDFFYQGTDNLRGYATWSCETP